MFSQNKFYKYFNASFTHSFGSGRFSSFRHHPELLPEIFINNKFFTFNDEIHKYNTRIKSNIHLHQ